MVQPGLSVNYKIAADNSGGVARINAGITALQSMDTFMKNVSMQHDLTIRDLLDSLKFNLNFYADATALAQWQAEGMLQHFMLQPYIVHDGTTYQSNIEIKDTLLTANGDAQSLEMLIGPMIDQRLDQMMP